MSRFVRRALPRVIGASFDGGLAIEVWLCGLIAIGIAINSRDPVNPRPLSSESRRLLIKFSVVATCADVKDRGSFVEGKEAGQSQLGPSSYPSPSRT